MMKAMSAGLGLIERMGEPAVVSSGAEIGAAIEVTTR
jgi:hypothetical protein